jgi:TolB-like protein
MKVAVMDVRALEGVSESAAKVITELIATEIQTLGRYDVISRTDVANMLGFQREKEMLGCAEDAQCMAEIGGALGTDYVLVGQVATFGSRYRIALSLQDVKKAKVVSRQGSFCDKNEDALAAATQEAVTNIFREVESGGQLPPPIVKQRAATPALAAEPAAPPPSALRKAGWATGGVGLAVLAAAGVFDYLGYAAYRDEKRAAADGDVAALDSYRSTSLSRRQTAKVLYAGGTLALGTGVVLHFVGAPKTAVSLDVRPLPGGAVALISGTIP